MRYIQDNIAAIASGSGQAGVGVIRISGNNLGELARILSGKQNLKPRFAHYSEFVDASGEVIDSGLIIWFDAPRSFTGEDVIEIAPHGSLLSPDFGSRLGRNCDSGKTQ